VLSPSVGNKVVLCAFHAVTNIVLSDRRTEVFWLDRWLLDGCLVGDIVPSLLNNMDCKHLGRSVANAINGHAWVRDIIGPNTVLVLLDYLKLWSIVRNVQLTANSLDVLLWR